MGVFGVFFVFFTSLWHYQFLFGVMKQLLPHWSDNVEISILERPRAHWEHKNVGFMRWRHSKWWEWAFHVWQGSLSLLFLSKTWCVFYLSWWRKHIIYLFHMIYSAEVDLNLDYRSPSNSCTCVCQWEGGGKVLICLHWKNKYKSLNGFIFPVIKPIFNLTFHVRYNLLRTDLATDIMQHSVQHSVYHYIQRQGLTAPLLWAGLSLYVTIKCLNRNILLVKLTDLATQKIHVIFFRLD